MIDPEIEAEMQEVEAFEDAGMTECIICGDYTGGEPVHALCVERDSENWLAAELGGEA